MDIHTKGCIFIHEDQTMGEKTRKNTAREYLNNCKHSVLSVLKASDAFIMVVYTNYVRVLEGSYEDC